MSSPISPKELTGKDVIDVFRDSEDAIAELGWRQMFVLLDEWLDLHYPTDIFGDGTRLTYSDGSGIDTTRGYGPAAVSALRIASKLAKNQDAQLW